MKYQIQDRNTGTVIDDNLTFDEARAMLEQFEEDDKEDGYYTPDYYEIKEMEEQE